MKVLVLGVKRMSGAKKDGKGTFDFAQVIIANPITPVNNEKIVIEGHGFEAGEIPLENGAERSFQGLKFPSQMELNLDHRLNRMGRIEAVCVGVNLGSSKVASVG